MYGIGENSNRWNDVTMAEKRRCLADTRDRPPNVYSLSAGMAERSFSHRRAGLRSIDGPDDYSTSDFSLTRNRVTMIHSSSSRQVTIQISFPPFRARR